MISFQNELIMMMMSAISYCLPTQFPVLKMNFYQVFQKALKFYLHSQATSCNICCSHNRTPASFKLWEDPIPFCLTFISINWKSLLTIHAKLLGDLITSFLGSHEDQYSAAIHDILQQINQSGKSNLSVKCLHQIPYVEILKKLDYTRTN